MDEMKTAFIVFALLGFVALGLAWLGIHDGPILEEYDRLNRIDYLTSTNSAMTNIEKIKIATEICEKRYSPYSEYIRRLWSPSWTLRDDIIPYCVDKLIKGEN